MILAVLIAGCGSDSGPVPATEPPSVGVIVVGKEKVNPFIEFVGKSRATESVALRARVTGFLERIDFVEGGKVKRNQVLFHIEPEQYLATLAQTEAALDAAEASLARAQVDHDMLLLAFLASVVPRVRVVLRSLLPARVAHDREPLLLLAR